MELGRISAKMMATPMVMTPSIRKSYNSCEHGAQVIGEKGEQILTHRHPSNPLFPSSLRIAIANSPPKAFPS